MNGSSAVACRCADRCAVVDACAGQCAATMTQTFRGRDFTTETLTLHTTITTYQDGAGEEVHECEESTGASSEATIVTSIVKITMMITEAILESTEVTSEEISDDREDVEAGADTTIKIPRCR